MEQQVIRITDFDSRHLASLIVGSQADDVLELELLERHLAGAQVMPAGRIGPDVVTMNSEVRVHYLDSHRPITFRLVFPGTADPGAGRISVLAPLGMAVLGRRVGERFRLVSPGGQRSLHLDRVLYQPEREGKDGA